MLPARRRRAPGQREGSGRSVHKPLRRREGTLQAKQTTLDAGLVCGAARQQADSNMHHKCLITSACKCARRAGGKCGQEAKLGQSGGLLRWRAIHTAS